MNHGLRGKGREERGKHTLCQNLKGGSHASAVLQGLEKEHVGGNLSQCWPWRVLLKILENRPSPSFRKLNVLHLPIPKWSCIDHANLGSTPSKRNRAQKWKLARIGWSILSNEFVAVFFFGPPHQAGDHHGTLHEGSYQVRPEVIRKESLGFALIWARIRMESTWATKYIYVYIL